MVSATTGDHNLAVDRCRGSDHVLNVPGFDALATVSTGVTRLPPKETDSCVYLDIAFVISAHIPRPPCYMYRS